MPTNASPSPLRTLALSMLAAAGLAAPAAARERDPDRAIQITPYVWAAGIGGSIRPFAGAPSIKHSQSFADVLENLDAAFFVSGYSRRDRFVLLGDFSHVSSSRSGIAQIPGLGPAPADGELEQTSLTLAIGYRAVSAPRVNVDLLGGFRAWSIKGAVNIAGGAINRSPSLDFADPILAARANLALSPRWSAIFYGDIGGFGAGSDLTTQVVATANYQLSDRVYLSAGYRRLHVDYSGSGAAIDASMSGPLFGATWRF